MIDTDALLDSAWPPPDAPDPVPTPRKCRRHDWTVAASPVPAPSPEWFCRRCLKPKDEALSRRGKQSRNYGNRAELEAARRYGGQKVGAAGGPVDIRGTDWNTQMKTHRRKPPAEWTTAFGKMEANRERMPRLLLRFVLGPGQPPQDYFVVRGEDWLAWHGKDEEQR